MRQRFRANLETASFPASWGDRQFGAPGETMTFRVDAARLIGTNSCKRCVVPTRDPSGAGELTVSQRTFVQQRHTSLPAWANGEHFDFHYRFATNTSPNGVLLSLDEHTLYVSVCDYGEDRLRELRAYPINDDGSLGRYTVLHQFGKDYRGTHRAVYGMCIDAEGNIIACAGWAKSGPGSLIYVFAPSGRVIETHALPADHPANCTFGDADLQSLYVTTRAGHLLRARTERQGRNL